MVDFVARFRESAASVRKRSASQVHNLDAFQANGGEVDIYVEYRNPNYSRLLREANINDTDHELGLAPGSLELCQSLLTNPQEPPRDTIFEDGTFENVLAQLSKRNEAEIFRHLTPLIAPCVEIYAWASNTKDLGVAVASTNEAWLCCRPITHPRPQPDYAVGFEWEAFTKTQLRKLRRYLGDSRTESYLMGTYFLHFPFFACEVKCSAGDLEVGDKQNLHSMSLAVRGIITLFRTVNRQNEVNREALAFSITHDALVVRIYAYYAVIDEESPEQTTFWRHTIRKFSIRDRNGLERWTAYKFTKNLYDTWMPMHLARIKSAIDDMPVPEVPPTITAMANRPKATPVSRKAKQNAKSSSQPVEIST